MFDPESGPKRSPNPLEEPIRDISVSMDWSDGTARRESEYTDGTSERQPVSQTSVGHHVAGVQNRHRGILTLEPSRLIGGFALRIRNRYSTADRTYRLRDQYAPPPADHGEKFAENENDTADHQSVQELAEVSFLPDDPPEPFGLDTDGNPPSWIDTSTADQHGSPEWRETQRRARDRTFGEAPAHLPPAAPEAESAIQKRDTNRDHRAIEEQSPTRNNRIPGPVSETQSQSETVAEWMSVANESTATTADERSGTVAVETGISGAPEFRYRQRTPSRASVATDDVPAATTHVDQRPSRERGRTTTTDDGRLSIATEQRVHGVHARRSTRPIGTAVPTGRAVDNNIRRLRSGWTATQHRSQRSQRSEASESVSTVVRSGDSESPTTETTGPSNATSSHREDPFDKCQQGDKYRSRNVNLADDGAGEPPVLERQRSTGRNQQPVRTVGAARADRRADTDSDRPTVRDSSNLLDGIGLPASHRDVTGTAGRRNAANSGGASATTGIVRSDAGGASVIKRGNRPRPTDWRPRAGQRPVPAVPESTADEHRAAGRQGSQRDRMTVLTTASRSSTVGYRSESQTGATSDGTSSHGDSDGSSSDSGWSGSPVRSTTAVIPRQRSPRVSGIDVGSKGVEAADRVAAADSVSPVADQSTPVRSDRQRRRSRVDPQYPAVRARSDTHSGSGRHWTETETEAVTADSSPGGTSIDPGETTPTSDDASVVGSESSSSPHPTDSSPRATIGSQLVRRSTRIHPAAQGERGRQSLTAWKLTRSNEVHAGPPANESGGDHRGGAVSNRNTAGGDTATTENPDAATALGLARESGGDVDGVRVRGPVDRSASFGSTTVPPSQATLEYRGSDSKRSSRRQAFRTTTSENTRPETTGPTSRIGAILTDISRNASHSPSISRLDSHPPAEPKPAETATDASNGRPTDRTAKSQQLVSAASTDRPRDHGTVRGQSNHPSQQSVSISATSVPLPGESATDRSSTNPNADTTPISRATSTTFVTERSDASRRPSIRSIPHRPGDRIASMGSHTGATGVQLATDNPRTTRSGAVPDSSAATARGMASRATVTTSGASAEAVSVDRPEDHGTVRGQSNHPSQQSVSLSATTARSSPSESVADRISTNPHAETTPVSQATSTAFITESSDAGSRLSIGSIPRNTGDRVASIGSHTAATDVRITSTSGVRTPSRAVPASSAATARGTGSRARVTFAGTRTVAGVEEPAKADSLLESTGRLSSPTNQDTNLFSGLTNQDTGRMTAEQGQIGNDATESSGTTVSATESETGGLGSVATSERSAPTLDNSAGRAQTAVHSERSTNAGRPRRSRLGVQFRSPTAHADATQRQELHANRTPEQPERHERASSPMASTPSNRTVPRASSPRLSFGTGSSVSGSKARSSVSETAAAEDTAGMGRSPGRASIRSSGAGSSLGTRTATVGGPVGSRIRILGTQSTRRDVSGGSSTAGMERRPSSDESSLVSRVSSVATERSPSNSQLEHQNHQQDSHQRQRSSFGQTAIETGTESVLENDETASVPSVVDSSPSLTVPRRVQMTGGERATEPAEINAEDEINKYKPSRSKSSIDESMVGTASSHTDRPALVYRAQQPIDTTGGEQQSRRGGGGEAASAHVSAPLTGDRKQKNALRSQSGPRSGDSVAATRSRPNGKRADRRVQSRRTEKSRRPDTSDRSRHGRRHEPVTNRSAVEGNSSPESGPPFPHEDRRSESVDRTGGSPPALSSAGPIGDSRDRHRTHIDQASGVPAHHATDDHSAQPRRAKSGVQLPDESLRYEADVDRVVERLHRKLERRKRIERERRGQQ